MLTLNVKVTFPLLIHDATLLHADRFDPKRHWNLGNLAGRDLNEEDEAQLDKMLSDLQAACLNGNPPAGLQPLLDQSHEVFMALLEPEINLDKIIPDKRFEFVVGAPRTGGTYFVSELFKAAKLDHTNFNKLMVHDGIPETHDIIHSNHPLRGISALFQLAQFLVWAREAFADSPVVIKKKIYFSLWLPQLARVFGDRATYYVTIRHPVPMIVSFMETLARLPRVKPDAMASMELDQHFDSVTNFNRITREQWFALNAFEKMLYVWETYYTAIGVSYVTKDQLVPLVMGDEMSAYLQQKNPDFVQSTHRSKKRDYEEYLEYFNISQDTVDLHISRVTNLWRAAGLKFPPLKVI